MEAWYSELVLGTNECPARMSYHFSLDTEFFDLFSCNLTLLWKSGKKMDNNFILRFPEIVDTIFTILDTENILKCQEVNREWNRFLSTSKFLFLRKIRKKLENNHQKFTGSWKNVGKNISTQSVSELEAAVTKYFRNDLYPYRKIH